MNYYEAQDYVKSFIPKGQAKFNTNWKLEKVNCLLEKLGNPQKDQHFIHIGGTSGKGSTSTLLAEILKESGYKTGLHISPHIISITERAQINGQNIPEEKFAEIVEEMKPAIHSVKEKFGSKASYFEILVCLAFLYFNKEKTDINVIEVGLGGMLDATNVIDSKYQIITSIGLDHTEILGDTKEKILNDKKEIIKENSIVVSGIEEDNLQRIIQEKCFATNSEIFFLNKDFHFTQKKEKFDFKNKNISLENLELNIKGNFQIYNASLAIQMAWKLKEKFPNISDNSIRNALKKIQLKGRFDIISENPLIIFDGAHNPDKIEALVNSIKSYYLNKKFITIFRYKKRNDINQSLEKIKEISEKIIITGSLTPKDNGNEENFTPEDIERINQNYTVEAILDCKSAFEKAKEYQRSNKKLGILATGSIFMIRELYA